MQRLKDKIAIVTGAGQGIGRGIARSLAGEDAAVVVAGRTYEKVARVADELNEQGGQALAVACDVNVRAQVEALVAETVKRFMLDTFGRPPGRPSRRLAK